MTAAPDPIGDAVREVALRVIRRHAAAQRERADGGQVEVETVLGGRTVRSVIVSPEARMALRAAVELDALAREVEVIS